MGIKTPIPFSETKVSPDKVSDLYTKTPSNTKFEIIFKRFKTNCVCRFLKLNIEIIDKITERKINPKIKGSDRSIITEPSSASIVGNQRNNIPIIKAETNKYKV